MKETRAHAVSTDVGYRRTVNQDAYCADAKRGIYAVADGMGGHPAGDVASQMVIRLLLESARQHLGACDLRPFFRRAHDTLVAHGRSHVDHRGLGTTLTALVLEGSTAYVTHVGDSACFLVHAGRATKVTVDHANNHVLENVLGGHDNFKGADLHAIRVERDDTLILASDGLTMYLKSLDILVEAAENLSSEKLLVHALDSGGQDNITVVMVRPHAPRSHAYGRPTTS